jgi:hypothetical protein
MAADSSLSSSPTTFSIVELMQHVEQGHVRVPNFQRDFKWSWQDVKKLFESIWRGYPIGSLLFWERHGDEQDVKLGSLQVRAKKQENALWVVDGQQRVSSIASVLSEHSDASDERFRLAFDLDKVEFVSGKRRSGSAIPLSELYDLPRLLTWFKDQPAFINKLELASRVSRSIREYRIPAYIVKSDDEKVLREIFDRMNNYGKRLTRSEVFTALHPSANTAHTPRGFAAIAERVDSKTGFGLLDEDTVMQALLARRGPDIMRDIRNEFTRENSEFPSEIEADAYVNLEQSLELAVRFLQHEACVPHVSFLAYRYLLIVLVRFFARFPQPEMRNIELLKRWYWRAVLIGPLSGATQSIRVFGSQIKALEESLSVQRLLREVGARPIVKRDWGTFDARTTASRMVLCALWSLHPRDLYTGETIELEQLSSALSKETSAKDIFVPLDRKLKAKVGIRLLHLSEIEVHQFSSIPNEETLLSHCLDPQLWQFLLDGDYDDFAKLRESRIRLELEKFIGVMTKSQLEDTPPLKFLLLNSDENDDDTLASERQELAEVEKS